MMLLLKREGFLIAIAVLALIIEYSSSPVVLGCHRRRESEDESLEESDVPDTDEESSRAGLIGSIASIAGSYLQGAGAGAGGLAGLGGLIGGAHGGHGGLGGPGGPGGGANMANIGRAFGGEVGKIMSSPEITGLVKSLTSTMTGAMKDSTGQVTSTVTNLITQRIEKSVETFIKSLQDAAKPREGDNGGGGPSMHGDGSQFPGMRPNSEYNSHTGSESGNGLDEGEGEGDVPPSFHHGPGPSNDRPPMNSYPGMGPPMDSQPGMGPPMDSHPEMRPPRDPSGGPPVDRPQDESRPPPGFPPASGPIGGSTSPDLGPIRGPPGEGHPIVDPAGGFPERKNPPNFNPWEGLINKQESDYNAGRREDHSPDHKEPMGGDPLRDHEKPHIQLPSSSLRKLRNRKRLLASMLGGQRSVMDEINRRDDFGDDEFDPEKVRFNTHRNMRNYFEDELSEVPRSYSIKRRPRRNIVSSKIFIGSPLDYKDQGSFPIGGSMKRGVTRQILTIV